MVKEKTWEEFRETGLLLIINHVLHVFGWAICFDFDSYDKETGEVGKLLKVYPARCKFRGFKDERIRESYKKVTEYMKNNIDELSKEINEN